MSMVTSTRSCCGRAAARVSEHLLAIHARGAGFLQFERHRQQR